jgi:peptidyl-prolyl cis-trans isomerase SurA
MADVTHRVRRPLTAALSVAALLGTGLLSACTGGPDLHPGDAAVVDGEAIRIDRVDALATDFCSLEEPGLTQQHAALPMALLRSVAVETLVTDALLPAFAKEAGVDFAAVRRDVRDEVEKAVAEAPAEIRDAATVRLELEGLRRAVLQVVGGQVAPPEQAAAAGAQVFAAWRADQDVETDPRFGAFDLDQLAWDGRDGSLGIATGDEEALDLEAAAALPADQRCGEGDPAGTAADEPDVVPAG